MSVFAFKQVLRNKYIVTIVSLIIGFSFIYGFMYFDFPPLIWLKEKFVLVRIFRFDRITWLNFVMWYFLFAFLIQKAFDQKKKYMLVLVYLLLFINLGYVFVRGDFDTALSMLRADKEHSMVTWKKFYSVKLFDQIKQDIGRPTDSFRTVNIGIFPAVSQYNGFYTLDSYQNNYSLAYKNQFRKIIAKELEKSDKQRSMFDNWGSKCFVFVAELDQYFWYIHGDPVIQNLELNTDALYQMGGRYIISSVEIGNYRDNHLRFLKKYTDSESLYKVWLYEVVSPSGYQSNVN
jgi:hypothetical protein